MLLAGYRPSDWPPKEDLRIGSSEAVPLEAVFLAKDNKKRNTTYISDLGIK